MDNELNCLLIGHVFCITTLWGIHEMWNEKFVDMWESANFFGRVITCVYAAILLPGIIVYGMGNILLTIYTRIHNLVFPRKSGYTVRIPYDEEVYRALKENHIYCEHWGQACLKSSVIVFLWKKDYEKALKLFPDIALEKTREEAARLKNDCVAAIDGYQEELKQLSKKIKDRQTASRVIGIAILLQKIALEVDEDPRDQKKVRRISEHSGRMIVDLVNKYIKLERQGQTGANSLAAMKKINDALDTVKSSLETLLNDLFFNDETDVAANVAALECILSGINPAYRLAPISGDKAR